MDLYNDTYLPDILHSVAQGLLVPAMAAILVMLALTLFFFGQVIFEYFCERRHFRQNMPEIINQISDAAYDGLTSVVSSSHLLAYQKAALIRICRNMGLGEEPLFALAQTEIGALERRFKQRLAWTDTIAKIAPLLGLMGTLIPLGPGIVALGQNDITLLSQSLLLAFDATVCGLICAIITLVLSRIRSGWYSQYVDSLESLVSCVIDRAAQARAAGVQLETGYIGDPLKEAKERARAAKAEKAAVAPDADEPADTDEGMNLAEDADGPADSDKDLDLAKDAETKAGE